MVAKKLHFKTCISEEILHIEPKCIHLVVDIKGELKLNLYIFEGYFLILVKSELVTLSVAH